MTTLHGMLGASHDEALPRRKARRGLNPSLLGAMLLCTCFLLPTRAVPAEAASRFQFETVVSLNDMQHMIQSTFALGSDRQTLRETFVTEGRGTLVANRSHPDTEKYMYDINLCSYYVWRWNISADYDPQGRLQQAYVNGEPVFSTGIQKRSAQDLPAGHQRIVKGTRLRPEASKGESSLSFVALEADDPSHLSTQWIGDLVIGGGPTRADPVNMGTVHAYASVDLWRSIFDPEAADAIHDYQGGCAAADEKYAKEKAAAAPQT